MHYAYLLFFSRGIIFCIPIFVLINKLDCSHLLGITIIIIEPSIITMIIWKLITIKNSVLVIVNFHGHYVYFFFLAFGKMKMQSVPNGKEEEEEPESWKWRELSLEIA